MGAGSGFDKVQHSADLFIRHKGTLHTHGLGSTDRQEQHIAVAQQLFGAAAVQNGAGVDLAGNCKCNTAGDVGFDQAGDNVHAGALGCHNQVDTGRTGFLGNAADIIFHLFAGNHHQVGQLVNDNGDIRQVFQHIGVLLGQLVIALDIAHIVFGKQLIAALHLGHTGPQGTGGLARLGHNGH